MLDDIRESVKITKDLLNHNIPENAYHYYTLYKWSDDITRFYHEELTNFNLGLIIEEARDCYNYALECVVWGAIDEKAQRNDRDLLGAELYLAAAITYQSPIAFLKVAQFYTPSSLTREVLDYALIPYNACLRCSIALGSREALETLISNYKNGLRMMRKKSFTSSTFKHSPKKRKLINGLDPYFDERFKSEYIKDPRDSDATKESIKEYYLIVWEMLVSLAEIYNFIPMEKNVFYYISIQIYSKLIYGYPSTRPYVFPKEILDLKIDFSKGLEGYGVDPNEKK